jgi:predicted Zn-dependent protease
MSMKTPDTPTWTYRAFKAGVMFWLVLGRGERARDLLDRMLQRWPDDAYVLSSRAHLHAQAGRRDAAIADAQALVHAHPARSAADWFNLAFLLERPSAPGRGRTGVPPRRRNRARSSTVPGTAWA